MMRKEFVCRTFNYFEALNEVKDLQRQGIKAFIDDTERRWDTRDYTTVTVYRVYKILEN